MYWIFIRLSCKKQTLCFLVKLWILDLKFKKLYDHEGIKWNDSWDWRFNDAWDQASQADYESILDMQLCLQIAFRLESSSNIGKVSQVIIGYSSVKSMSY
jgi:hypothetical protein